MAVVGTGACFLWMVFDRNNYAVDARFLALDKDGVIIFAALIRWSVDRCIAVLWHPNLF